MTDTTRARWRLRPATLADAADLGRLHTEGWQQGYRGLLPDSYLDGLDEDAAVARWTARLADPKGLQVLVAEDELGRCLGFCSIGPCFDPDARAGEWEVWDAWVGAGMRGMGIGGDLLARALRLTPPEVDVVVWVLAANAGAVRFYERHGARRDGLQRRTRRPGVTIHDVRLRWRPREGTRLAHEVGAAGA